MNYLTIIFLIAMLANTNLTNAQDLSHHHWKNRVLLILTDDTAAFNKQILAFKTNEKGINERKLIIYHVKSNEFKQVLPDGIEQKSKRLFEQYKQTNAPFEVILIGLDSGIKLKQISFLSCQTLFNIIDSMPVRSAEISPRN